jgi:hypothetical protein
LEVTKNAEKEARRQVDLLRVQVEEGQRRVSEKIKEVPIMMMMMIDDGCILIDVLAFSGAKAGEQTKG